MGKNVEVSVGGGDCKDKTNGRSPCAKNLNKTTGYLTPNTKQIFIQLRKGFTKAPILRYFDSECHIWIETDASSYAISGVLGQMTLDNWG